MERTRSVHKILVVDFVNDVLDTSEPYDRYFFITYSTLLHLHLRRNPGSRTLESDS